MAINKTHNVTTNSTAQKLNAISELLSLCNQFSSQLQHNPGDLLADRDGLAVKLIELLKQAESYHPIAPPVTTPQKAIAIVWAIEDIQGQRVDLTVEQAQEVLKSLDKNRDAEIGINWETIDIVCDELFPQD